MTMKYALLLLLLLAACGMIGELSQGATEAGGVVATTALLSPLAGFLSWPIWSWLGDWLSRWLTGTERARVEAVDSDVHGGLDLPDPAGILGITTGDTMLWILGLIAFVALGGPAWALKKIRDARAEDADWTEKNATDRTAHKERTARLEAKVDLLERLLSADKKHPT